MSFLDILSNQKLARAFMSTPEAIARANFGTKTAGSVTSREVICHQLRLVPLRYLQHMQLFLGIKKTKFKVLENFTLQK